MAHALAKVESQAQPRDDFQSKYLAQYCVYVYHFVENQHDGVNDWEMRFQTSDRELAIEKAQALYESYGYRKVEVKQKLFDPKILKAQDVTLRVFSPDAHNSMVGVWCFALAAVAALVAGVALVVGLF